MLYPLYFFLTIIIFKFFSNLSKYLQCKKLLKLYQLYLAETEGGYSNLMQHKKQIIQLFKDAGVNDSFVSVVKPAGWGYVQKGNISAFENLGNKRQDVFARVHSAFHEAIGVYKSQMLVGHPTRLSPFRLYFDESYVFCARHKFSLR